MAEPVDALLARIAKYTTQNRATPMQAGLGVLSTPPVSCLVDVVQKGCDPQFTPEQIAASNQAFLAAMSITAKTPSKTLTWAALCIFLPMLLSAIIVLWLLAAYRVISWGLASLATVAAFILFYGPFLIMRHAGANYVYSKLSDASSLPLYRVPSAALSAACALTCDGSAPCPGMC